MIPGFLGGVVALGLSLRHLGTPPPPPPPLDGPVDRIVVDKSDRTLSLLRGDEVLRTYPVGLGPEPEGDKLAEGDGRTPEGTFRIDLRKDDSQYHLALRIDYPRPEDLARARAAGVDPGGDIFIHGQPDVLRIADDARIAGDWTAGCIAVTDAAMDEIWSVVPVGTTVEVVP